MEPRSDEVSIDISAPPERVGPWYVKALYAIPGTLPKARADQVEGMRRTLENIKQTAEARPD